MTRWTVLTALACTLAAHGAENGSVIHTSTADTGTVQDTAAVLGDSTDSAPPDSQVIRNPWVAGALSAVIPGAGQMYTRSYVKGPLYLVSEVGLGLYAANRFRAAEKFDDDIKRFNREYERLRDSLPGPDTSAWYRWETITDSVDTAGMVVWSDTVADSIIGPTVYRMARDTAMLKRDKLRNSAYQSLWWGASCHMYCILDALEKSGRFRNDEPRNPKAAGWLSAIPFLGLGQWYNGRLSKAGMIFMVQTSTALMAYNNHRILVRSERELRQMSDPSRTEYSVVNELENGDEFYDEWDSSRKQAFRNRNTYLWYSLFFYFYNVFDAVVDAHLHDHSRRMQLEPDLVPGDNTVGMRMRYDF